MSKIVYLIIFSSFFLFAGENSITVTGKGESKTTPDLAYVSFSIRTIDKSASSSQAQNAKIAKRVLSALKKFGIKGKDIQSTGFRLNPEFNYQKRKRVLVGHRVSHSYQSVVRKVKEVGKVLDSLTKEGTEFITIGNVTFGTSDEESLKLKALELGFKKAKEKALVLAKSADASLGEVMAIEEASQSFSPPVRSMEMMKASSAMDSTSVEVGEMGVSSRVNVKFKLNSSN